MRKPMFARAWRSSPIIAKWTKVVRDGNIKLE
jgi:hypothetical protein